MTRLLLRLFVRNYGNTKDLSVRLSVGRLAGATGIVCNLLLFIGKVLMGMAAGSVAVIADGMNNLSDASSSLVTLLGFQLAKRPADEDHPYGHARYEYISGIIVSGLILLIGVQLVKSSAVKIFNPSETIFGNITFICLLVSVGIKLWMAVFYKKLGKMISSTTLTAAAMDSRNDVITTLAVLASGIIGKFTDFNPDGYIGLLVAAFILWSGVKIGRETISPLLGMGADKELADIIGKKVLAHKDVIGIHDLLLHDYGPGKCFASLHAELSADKNPLVCHDIIDEIECEILEELNVNLVIHYDPVLVNDAEWEEMRNIVSEIIRNINPLFSMHDFRMVRGAKQEKLVFDLAVPYSEEVSYQDIKKKIEDTLKEKGKSYVLVIRFDKK